MPRRLRIDRDIAFAMASIAGHDVAIVAAAEIFHVALREGFALSVAAARIGAERKISHRRRQAPIVRASQRGLQADEGRRAR